MEAQVGGGATEDWAAAEGGALRGFSVAQADGVRAIETRAAPVTGDADGQDAREVTLAAGGDAVDAPASTGQGEHGNTQQNQPQQHHRDRECHRPGLQGWRAVRAEETRHTREA
ncbi:MAG: hypothetical protein DYG94_14115 [Leptolyngbya sp. PLA3]|nr:MAG: hypothetical protein EDM82_14670 [Cyanobacteria bacterium CYA]MCE7969863.1 hypothetical protein [Leptolyngbya sp. PL-A3]